VQGGGDEDDAAARGGVCAGVLVGGGGLEEVGERRFEGVVGAEDVDVDYGFEGVRGEAGEWGEEVACCAGTVGPISVSYPQIRCFLDDGENDVHNVVNSTELLDGPLSGCCERFNAADVDTSQPQNF
jgi:hypothetical protein